MGKDMGRGGSKGTDLRERWEPRDQQSWSSSSRLIDAFGDVGRNCRGLQLPRTHETTTTCVHRSALRRTTSLALPSQRDSGTKRGCTKPPNGNPNPQHVTESPGTWLFSFSFCDPRTVPLPFHFWVGHTRC